MYCVKTLKSKIAVEVLGFEQEIDLSWAVGMVGAVAVFDDYDCALQYASGNIDLITEVKEVTK